MRKFKEGKFRKPSGYWKFRLSNKPIQELSTSGEVDDEFWSLIEFHSEIESYGLEFLKKIGINNISTRLKIYKYFQAYVRQAKNYYYSAKSLPAKSSSLLYYYSFMNLAVAMLAIENPTKVGSKDYHGLTYKNIYGPFDKQTIKVKENGVFPKLYNCYFGKKISTKHFNISSLLNYCTDIAYQCNIAGISEDKILYCYGGIHLTSVHTIYRLKCRVYKILQTLHIVVTPVTVK